MNHPLSQKFTELFGCVSNVATGLYVMNSECTVAILVYNHKYTHKKMGWHRGKLSLLPWQPQETQPAVRNCMRQKCIQGKMKPNTKYPVTRRAEINTISVW